MNDSKNQAVCARCHFAGEASGHDYTIMSSGVNGSTSSSVRRRALLNRSAKSTAAVVKVIVLNAFSSPYWDES